MDRKQIKAWHRQLIYRKVARFIRMHGQEASETLLAVALVPACAWVLFTGTWAVFG